MEHTHQMTTPQLLIIWFLASLVLGAMAALSIKVAEHNRWIRENEERNRRRREALRNK